MFKSPLKKIKDGGKERQGEMKKGRKVGNGIEN